MKRIVALMLALVMMCSVALTGCGSSSTSDSGEKLKIGYVYIGVPGDVGYTYAHDLGRQMVEQELGDQVETKVVENVPETAECEKTMRNLIDQGCKVIFATSYGYMDYVKKLADEFPDVKFFHCSGEKSNDTNFVNYFGQIEQPRYLAGIAAGLKTKSGKIGYVAAMQIPEVVRGINAFTLGVRSVNPNATVNVKWTDTWYDPQKEKDTATALLNEGCDVIAQHQDTTAPQQAAEEKNAFAIGYNSDSPNAAPKAYMTAPIWNWGVYTVDQVKKILDGSWKAENYNGDMKDGVVKLAPLTDLVPAEAKTKIEEVEKKFMDRSFNVFDGPIKDQTGAIKVAEGESVSLEDQRSMLWFVEGVVGKIDTK